MTDAQNEPSNANLESDDREDVQDDAVIGTAFRASLIFAMLMGIPIIGFLIYLNLQKKEVENTEVTEVITPDIREIAEETIPDLKLTDVSEICGIDFQHNSGRYGDKLLPETMGSGVAVLDYNGDGHLDLFFVNSQNWPWDESNNELTTCKLYEGDGDFQFTDKTKQAGLDISLYGMGVAVGDYDNDGDPDLFVSAVGENRLLRNEAGKFVDVTNDAGVAGSSNAWSTSCGFVDYDNDGLLDLFVCNYVDWSKQKDLGQNFTLDGESRAYGPPKAFAGSFSYLFHNDGGKFSDVSASSGIQVRNKDTNVPLGKGMGLAPVDVNRDGWIDLVVANDTVRNFLFENNQDGTFTEKGRLAGIAFGRDGMARGAMGIDTSVFRPNGTIAIGIGNFANEQSALFMASPKRSQFIDGAIATGLGPPTRQGLTFGFFFFDIDLDGRLDILGANGHLEEEIAKTQDTQRYEQSPQLFWNAGRDSSSELVEVTEACTGSGFCEPVVGRGATYGDFDGDGDQDIVISVSDGPPRIFRNDQKLGHHWIRLQLIGTKCNRDAIGARVTLKSGDSKFVQQVMPTRSYLSQSEPILTFGLGKELRKPNELQINWPGGTETTHAVDSIDQQIVIQQP